jgi:hypothetical protein
MRLVARVVAMTFLVLSFVPTAWTQPPVSPTPGEVLAPEYVLLHQLWFPQLIEVTAADPIEATPADPRQCDGDARPYRLRPTPNEDTDPRGCRCVSWQPVCACIPNCYQVLDNCRTDLECTPDGCTEKQECDTVWRCTYDCWCYTDCMRWECYI